MKYLISTLGVVFVITLNISSALGEYVFPSASMFNPSAHLFRGRKQDFQKWLEVHGASSFASLVANSNLEAELNAEDNTVTIFAPVDEAFNNLSIESKNVLSNPESQKKLIQYHLVPGAISDNDIKKQKIVTVEGSSIKITATISEDGSTKVFLNDNSRVQKIEKVGDNLVVILIDGILIPPNISINNS